jgi:hypothetical protein
VKAINQTVILIALMLSVTFAHGSAAIKNAKTDVVKVSGKCDTCKHTIELAANKKGLVSAEWNVNSKMLTMTYNSQKTSADEILKRVAYAGYDNEKYMAPNDTYEQLPPCCQYERNKSEVAVNAVQKEDPKIVVQTDTTKQKSKMSDMPEMKEQAKSATSAIQIHPLSDVYGAYFSLKDALAKDDGKNAAAYSNSLYKAIDNVPMEKLPMEQHMVWMKYEKLLSTDAEHIKSTTDIDHQREHLISLSKNMYAVMKAIKPEAPVYYEFCPMANDGKGANWLSREAKISNPYMGSMMPGCGKVQETIK